MDREVRGVCALVAALLVTALGSGAESPPMNQLHGTVVYAEDGRPAAGATVVMASTEKGYIYIVAETGLHGYGEEDKVLWLFTKQNSKHCCVAITDAAGRFTVKNFASPGEPWVVAAGDPERGYGLLPSLRPKDYVDEPLRIEIDKPGFISTTPPSPPAKSLHVSLGVALAPTEPAQPSSGAKESAAAETEDTVSRVHFFGPSLSGGLGQKPIRIGPLPGGQTYLVTAYAMGSNVPYQATIFERTVDVAVGATADISLESADGATVSGRISSSGDEPLANVNVMVKATDGLVVGTLTDSEGKYELRGIPAGTHELKLLRHAKRKTPG